MSKGTSQAGGCPKLAATAIPSNENPAATASDSRRAALWMVVSTASVP